MKELATQTSSVVTVRHGDRKVLYKPKDKAGFKGVFKCGRKYKAQIQIDKVRHYLGLFDTEIEAAQAYDDYALKVLGSKARLNIPTDSAATSTAVIPEEKNKDMKAQETSFTTMQNPGRLGNIRAPTTTSYPATAAFPTMAHMFPTFPPFPGYPLPMPHGIQFNPSLSMSASSPRIEELPSTATPTSGSSPTSSKNHTMLEHSNSSGIIEPSNSIPHTSSIQNMGIVQVRHHPAQHSPDPLLQQYHPYLHMQAYMMAQQHYFMNFPQAAAMSGSSAYPYPYSVGDLPQQQSGSYYRPTPAPAYPFPSSSSSSSAVSYEQFQPQHQQQFYGQVQQQLLPQQQMYPSMGVYNNLPLSQQLQPAPSIQQQKPLPQPQQSPVEEPGEVPDTGQLSKPETDTTPAVATTVSSDVASSTESESTAEDAAA